MQDVCCSGVWFNIVVNCRIVSVLGPLPRKGCMQVRLTVVQEKCFVEKHLEYRAIWTNRPNFFLKCSLDPELQLLSTIFFIFFVVDQKFLVIYIETMYYCNKKVANMIHMYPKYFISSLISSKCLIFE